MHNFVYKVSRYYIPQEKNETTCYEIQKKIATAKKTVFFKHIINQYSNL